MIASSNPVEIPCDSGMSSVQKITSINSRCLDSFPFEQDLVPDDLLRACAAVKASNHMGRDQRFPGIDNLDEIRDYSRSNAARMFKVLKSWSKRAKSPTVGKLLKWFEEVGINRRLIIMKFEELYG